jgi:hypothetical protein
MQPGPGLKRPLFLLAGVCGCLCALGFGFLLFQYIAEGAGLQVFGLGVSSGSVLVGLVHVVGFATGALVFFALGATLCARAIVPRKQCEVPRSQRTRQS